MATIRIRAEQVPPLDPDRERFVERAMAFLRTHLADECRGLGDDELRAFVEHGLVKAASYGIDAQPDVCKLLALMSMLGRDFDRDPAFAWAQPYLAKVHERGPTLQIDRLQREASKRLARARTQGRR
jgi:hypothetical protein